MLTHTAVMVAARALDGEGGEGRKGGQVDGVEMIRARVQRNQNGTDRSEAK